MNWVHLVGLAGGILATPLTLLVLNKIVTGVEMPVNILPFDASIAVVLWLAGFVCAGFWVVSMRGVGV